MPKLQSLVLNDRRSARQKGSNDSLLYQKFHYFGTCHGSSSYTAEFQWNEEHSILSGIKVFNQSQV